MISIDFDTSELVVLAGILTEAGAKVAVGAPRVVDKGAQEVRDQAASNARAWFTKGSGATASSVQVGGSGLSRIITSPTRGGFYSELGSPNTGPPRPWLTSAGDRGAETLGEGLQDLGDVW